MIAILRDGAKRLMGAVSLLMLDGLPPCQAQACACLRAVNAACLLQQHQGPLGSRAWDWSSMMVAGSVPNTFSFSAPLLDVPSAKLSPVPCKPFTRACSNSDEAL